MGVRSYVGKAKTNPSTLHMDGTSPVVIHLQATTDELRDMHNRKVLVVLYTDDDTDQPVDPTDGWPSVQRIEGDDLGANYGREMSAEIVLTPEDEDKIADLLQRNDRRDDAD